MVGSSSRASLSPPSSGFDPNYRFIDDLKRKDFISAVVFTARQIAGADFMKEFLKAGK